MNIYKYNIKKKKSIEDEWHFVQAKDVEEAWEKIPSDHRDELILVAEENGYSIKVLLEWRFNYVDKITIKWLSERSEGELKTCKERLEFYTKQFKELQENSLRLELAKDVLES
jgi:hypothetical protein